MPTAELGIDAGSVVDEVGSSAVVAAPFFAADSCKESDNMNFDCVLFVSCFSSLHAAPAPPTASFVCVPAVVPASAT